MAAVSREDGRRDAFFYGQATRLERARHADGTDIRYHYAKGVMPETITVNGAPAAAYQWRERFRLMQYKSAAKGLTHDFVYGEARAPLRVVVSGGKEAVFRATGLYARQAVLDIFTDQVDSVRVLALPDGRPVKCIEYDSFGNVAVDTRPEWDFPLGFACGLRDPWTGFVRFGFRDYDPYFGRFTTRDPLGHTGGDNDLWEYCVDDPVGCFDPDGLLTRSAQASRSDPYFREAARGVSEHRLSAEDKKSLLATGRQLGLGTGAVVDGALGTLDTMATPFRGALNAVNGLLGGDKNYFRPARGTVTDMVGLPKPQTPQERLIYALNEGASSALTGAGLLGGTQAGASALNMAGKGVEQAARYVPAAYQAAASALGSAYDKAKPVAGRVLSAAKDVPQRVLTDPQTAVDFVEGALMPGPVSPANYSKLAGYAAKKGFDGLYEFLNNRK